jgi:hypothetical protein
MILVAIPVRDAHAAHAQDAEPQSLGAPGATVIQQNRKGRRRDLDVRLRFGDAGIRTRERQILQLYTPQWVMAR